MMTQSNVFPANLIWRTLGSHVRMTFGSFYVVLLIYMLSFSITIAQRDDEISQNIIEDGGTNGTAFNIDSNIYTKNDSFVQTSTIKFNIITSKPGVPVSSITVPLNGLNSSNNQDKSLELTGKDELSEGPKIVAYESNSIISQTTSKPIISIPSLWSSQVPSDVPIVLDQSTDKSLELKENEESSLAHSTTPQPHLKDEDIKMPSQEDVAVLNATELQPQVTIKPNISSYSVVDSNKYKNKFPISPLLVNSISNFQTSIGEITQIEDTTNNEFFNEPSSEHFASDLSSSTARTFEQSSTIANNENILGSVSPSSQYVNDMIRNNTSDSSVFSVSETTDSSVSENSQTMLKSETNIPVTNIISVISSSEPMSSSVSSYMEIPDSTIPEMLTSDIPNSSYDENSIDSTIDNSYTVTTEVTTEFTTHTATETTTTCTEDFENLGLDPEIISVSEESIEVFVHVNSTCTHQFNYNVSWINLETDESGSTVFTDSVLNISSLQPCSNYNISVELIDTDEITGNEDRPTANIVQRTAYRVPQPPAITPEQVNKTTSVFQLNVEYEGPACAPTNCTVNCVVIDSFQRPGLANRSGFSTGIFTVTVSDLSPFTNYSCVAYATNEGGDSENSESVTITTLEDVPPAPENLNVNEMDGVVTIEWTIDDVPGILQKFIVSALFISCEATKCTNNPSSINYTVEPDKRSYSTDQLDHFSVYNITVQAFTNAGAGKTSVPFTYKTHPAESESVQNLNAQFDRDDLHNDWNVVLTWELPNITNGILESFDIYNEDFYDSLNYSDDNCCEYFLTHLRPEYYYSIKVAAKVEGFNGEPNNSLTSISFTSPSGIPKTSNSSIYIGADPYATSVATQTQITFHQALFDDSGGGINWYEVIVAHSGNQQEPTHGLYEDVGSIPEFPSWSYAPHGRPYRASPKYWKPIFYAQATTFLLGDQDCNEVQDSDCNGPLDPDTNYVVKIRAFTGNCSNNFCKGGYQDSNTISFTTGSEIAVGMIVGIMFAIIIFGFLAILFIMYRKGTLVWPPKLLSGVPQVTVRPQPILLKKFPAYCAQLLDTPNRLKNEFQLLATLSADLVAVNTVRFGEQPENRRKNRYCNILPYDSTRVILDLVDGDPTSHYINASFIKGYSVDIEYIACQGPLEDTCQDFWRMVYQHDVHVIAMVTNLVEQNKLKCHQYYPNLQESLVFGDMTIRCTKEMNFPIHTARTLVLIKGDRKRTISHLHFREWPDFGVPQSTDFMLQFCQTMRHHAMAAEIGLILVHCSAGVGRTGTLIALDILLQHISENKKVDIFGTVFKLREQRINMVQTEGQYTYIYRCIKEAVQDPTIVSQGTTTNNSLEPIYENVGTTLNSIPYEYEKLPKWRRA